jgi:bacteriocin biosynthesis cyclodehydratase domain-containing protein
MDSRPTKNNGNDNENLRIKRHFSVIPHGPDVVELRWGIWNPTSFTLTDDAGSGQLYRLIRRLNGSVSPRALAREENVPRSEVEGLIDHLIELGVIDHGPTNALDHYIDNYLPTTGATEARDPGTPRILLLGELQPVDEICRILNASLPHAAISRVPTDDPAWTLLADRDTSWLLDGIDFHQRLPVFEGWKESFIVFASRIINPVHFRVLNRVALALGIPWLHAAMDGPFLIIGPTVVPNRSACYECLETRVLMNLRDAAGYQRYKKALVEAELVHNTQPVLAALSSLFASHTALEALNFALTGGAFTVNKALTIHIPTMEFAFNEVLRVPNCGACGSSPERDDQALYFDMRAFFLGSGG